MTTSSPHRFHPALVLLAGSLVFVIGVACSGRPAPTTVASRPVPEAVAEEKPAEPAPLDAQPGEAESAGPESAASEAPAADTAPLSNTIRWSTASEVDNFGFNVYRGSTEDGPFEKLNDEIIAGAITTDEPQAYSFTDDTIDPYATYFYYVESISLSGVREKFTPVGRAKPKLQKGDG